MEGFRGVSIGGSRNLIHASKPIYRNRGSPKNRPGFEAGFRKEDSEEPFDSSPCSHGCLLASYVDGGSLPDAVGLSYASVPGVLHVGSPEGAGILLLGTGESVEELYVSVPRTLGALVGFGERYGSATRHPRYAYASSHSLLILGCEDREDLRPVEAREGLAGVFPLTTATRLRQLELHVEEICEERHLDLLHNLLYGLVSGLRIIAYIFFCKERGGVRVPAGSLGRTGFSHSSAGSGHVDMGELHVEEICEERHLDLLHNLRPSFVFPLHNMDFTASFYREPAARVPVCPLAGTVLSCDGIRDSLGKRAGFGPQEVERKTPRASPLTPKTHLPALGDVD